MSAKNAKRVIGTIAVVTAIAGTMAFGDAVGFNRIFNRTAAKISPESYVVEQGFYQKPYDLSIVVEKNDSGKVESYLITKEQRYPVMQGAQDVLVGSIDDIAKNLTEGQQEQIFQGFSDQEQKTIVTDYMKQKVGEGVEQGKNWLKDLYDKLKDYFQNP
ncbi:MAG: hypothetical protein NTZ02_01000 [Candidatus Woesearchaeota archaeon]|jgi:hypothetical protein|nr:hypothetical protein [Candidatus Woesearchaeota archaeon]